MEKDHNFTEESQCAFWLAAFICFNSLDLSYTTEQPQVCRGALALTLLGREETFWHHSALCLCSVGSRWNAWIGWIEPVYAWKSFMILDRLARLLVKCPYWHPSFKDSKLESSAVRKNITATLHFKLIETHMRDSDSVIPLLSTSNNQLMSIFQRISCHPIWGYCGDDFHPVRVCWLGSAGFLWLVRGKVRVQSREI